MWLEGPDNATFRRFQESGHDDGRRYSDLPVIPEG